MHARIEEIELQALQAQVQPGRGARAGAPLLPAELAVPYRGSLELVRAADARSPFPAFADRRPR